MGKKCGKNERSKIIRFIKYAQGTVTDVTDSSGTKLMHYVYSAFGELIGVKDAYGADVTSAPPVATSFTYTGREHDSESGYYYYRARYYDSSLGRFLQSDPEPGKLNLPATVVNKFAYVVNNPLNFTDPSGMSFWGSLLSGLAWVGGAVAFTAFAIVTGGVGAILLGAVAAGMASASITAFSGGTVAQQLGTFANATVLAGTIGMGGFAAGALLGVTAGVAVGAGLGATIGAVVGYKAGGVGMAIVGGVVGAFTGGFAAAAGAGVVTASYSALNAPAPVPDWIPIAPPEPDLLPATVP